MTIPMLLVVFGSALLVIAGTLARRLERKREAAEVQRIGSAFEVGVVASRLEQVRRDYVAAAHLPSHGSWCRTQLLRTTRRTLTGLSFFQSRRKDPQEHHELAT